MPQNRRTGFRCVGGHTRRAARWRSKLRVLQDTERTMNTTNANGLIAARRRLLPWAAVALSIAAGFAIGLWAAKSISLAAIGPDKAVAAKVIPPVADAAVQTFP